MSDLKVGSVVFAPTPGPWRVGGYRALQTFEIVGPKGEDIAYVNESDGADEPQIYPVESNASLIAAAPDLLAALTALWEWVWEDNRGDGQYPEALVRAALAKAEGKQS